MSTKDQARVLLLGVAVILSLLALSVVVPVVADQSHLETLTPSASPSATATPGHIPRMLGTPVSITRHHQLLAPSYSGCGGELAPVVNADFEQQVVELTNAVRTDAGLPPLKRVTPLDEAARYHATDMGQDDYFAHESKDWIDGTLQTVCEWSERVKTYYIDPYGITQWLMAENIAAGQLTPEEVMQDWMDSAGHRDNILRSGIWEIGVGYAFESSAYYKRYWVQDFGRRFDIYPLIINDEAATTDSVDVSLYAYGNWDEIRLRNNDDTWTNWMPFQNELAWTLTGEGGEQTVWAEMRDSFQTVTSSDTIEFTGAPPMTTATPTATVVPPTCPDVDGSGFVSVADIALVAANWGATEPDLLLLYDFSGNHIVDVDDIQAVVAHWGEPSTC